MLLTGCSGFVIRCLIVKVSNVPAMMMYRPCTGRDHTLYNGILIGIALKELMVCDVDHHYLRLVILCKTGGGDMCI